MKPATHTCVCVPPTQPYVNVARVASASALGGREEYFTAETAYATQKLDGTNLGINAAGGLYGSPAAARPPACARPFLVPANSESQCSSAPRMVSPATCVAGRRRRIGDDKSHYCKTALAPLRGRSSQQGGGRHGLRVPALGAWVTDLDV